jgi:peptide/nickel transport system substrate-binding protein
MKPDALTGTVVLQDSLPPRPDWPDENTLVVLLSDEPAGLHPVFGSDNYRAEIFHYLHQPLFRILDGGRREPVLLKHLPKVSGDGTTYTCELKEGLRWDDGTPVTAADVLFTFKVNRCETVNSQLRGYWKRIVRADTDPEHPLVFNFTTDSKNPETIDFLSDFPVLERDFHDALHRLDGISFAELSDSSSLTDPLLAEWISGFNSDENGRLPEKLNGLGKYRITTWKSREEIVLTRKKTAGDQGPEKIIYRFGNDETGIIRELKRQSYDVACYLSTGGFLSAASESSVRENYHCVLLPTYGYTFVAFNRRTDKQSLLKDPKLRKAISQLIPCEKIAGNLYGSYSAFLPRMGSAVSRLKSECDTTVLSPVFNPSSALKALEAAGWIDSDRDGVPEKGGRALTLRLVYRNTSYDWKVIADLISEGLGRAGIVTELQPADNKTFSEKAADGDFDLLLGSMSGTSAMEDFTTCWSTASIGKGGKNYPGFGDAATDALIDSINVCYDRQERITLSRRMQRMIHDDYPCVFLYGTVRRNIVHKRWKNIVLLPGRPGIRLDEMQLRK